MTTQPPSLAAAFSLLAAFLAAISAWNFMNSSMCGSMAPARASAMSTCRSDSYYEVAADRALG